MGIVIALGSIALVNGLWSKTLQVNGTVTTGDLNAQWDCAYTNDDAATTTCPAPAVSESAGDLGGDPHGSFPPFPYSDPFVVKDVGKCTVAIEPGSGANTNLVANATISNGYPSYECTITLALSNIGSIPFNFTGATIGTDAASSGKIELLANTCTVPTGASVQVDPGNDASVACTVHVMEAAAQNTCTGTTATSTNGGTPRPVVSPTCTSTTTGTYHFSLFACVAQWNEAATLAQCQSSTQREGPAPTP